MNITLLYIHTTRYLDEMKDIVDTPFFHKIQALFEYRGIPALLDYGGISSKSFEAHLYNLQSSIYVLDDYLETTWDLDESVIQLYWSGMKSQLRNFVIEADLLDQYLYQIQVYLKREVGLRMGKFPLDVSLKYFYYYKSCDVRLMRRLIYDHSVQNRSKLHPRNWLVYDYITEVNDDVDDVIEDLDIYNCNRLLFECYANGVDKAGQSFKTFIGNLDEMNRLSKTPTHIKRDTSTAISDTLLLLDERLDWLERVDLQDFKLFSHF